MNKKNMQYIRLMNFDNEANTVVNRAIQISISENCSEINTVHLFLALAEKTELGDNILESFGISFDMLYESYQITADSGVYGKVSENADVYNTDTYSLDAMTQELYMILATVATKTAMRRKCVTSKILLNELLNIDSAVLNDFLDYVGISVEEIKTANSSKFSIPEPLQSFVVDMNSEKDKNNEEISNVDNYVDTMVEVLSRKLEANPCLVGEAGVGKTTIARAFVQRIIKGEVPKQFKDTHVIYINSSLLTSGTRYRGDFEERMKCLIDWASKSNIILFLDEIHTFINLNSNGDSSDTAGNMIKKALSDGDIKIIGATTNKEYHKFIETDAAFSRRLQVVDIKEPSVETAITMVSHTISNYEQFHKVRIPEECIKLAVELSSRYIKDKALPAKAYKILDQAGTVVKLSNREEVTTDDVLNTVSKITGINVNKLNKSEAKQLLNLEKTISKQLIGQENAVATVCKAIRRAKAGVREEGKPLASFMFVGPTGVGKTELCRVLSKEVAIGDVSFIKVDMSEFSEKHSTSKMIGTAPGYVGYGDGGQLTEKVKHNPYSLILFDEIEKADHEVYNIFLQLLDEGKMTDGEGNTVDFTNCIIVMTSNAGYGAEKLGKSTLGFNVSEADTVDSEKIAMEALKETFKPEFLNRLDNIVIFDKLTEEQSKEIVTLMLSQLTKRVLKNSGVEVVFRKSLVDHIAENGFSSEYGARNLRREIQNTVEDLLADEILSDELTNGDKAVVTWQKNKVVVTKK